MEKKEEYKYTISLKENSKKERYIGEIKIRSDDLDSLEEQIRKVKQIVEVEWK